MKFVIFLLLFSNYLFGQSLEIIGDKKYKLGDSFNIILRLNQSVSEESFQKALDESKRKMGPFHVAKLSFVKSVESGTIIGLGVIFEKNVKNDSFPIVFSPTNIINISISNREKLLYDKPDIKQQFHVFDRDVKIDESWSLYYLLAGIAVIALVGLGGWKYRSFFKEKLIQKREKELKDSWVFNFKKAHSRLDFENIYKNRNIWIKWCDNSSSKLFLETMDEHQYKKSWDQKAMYEVTTSFEKIRDGLS